MAAQAGGLEKYAHRIAMAFMQRGHRVTLAMPASTSPSPMPPHPLLSLLPIRTAKWPSFLRIEQFDRAIQQWISQTNPAIVFGMDRNRFQTHLRAGNGVHRAYLNNRSRAEGRFKTWGLYLNPMHIKILEIEKQAFENQRLKKIFTNSYMVEREILEHYRVDPAKIETIHNGVEWAEMGEDFAAWETQRGEMARQWGLDPDLFHFLFVGNGYLRKGLDPLLEGLACLKRRDFYLSIVGKESRLAAYRAKVTRLRLDKNVRFFGPQKNMRPFYQLADSLALPSFYDPFANVTIEALAMGLFVLSSPYNGASEIVSPLHGWILEELGNVDAMAHALEETMRHRKTRASARAARQSVAHLDFSQQLHKIVESTERDVQIGV
jgi:UDP-glucose:(heptosyl)LPS alpha-1,3-glucosyltransferase